MTTSLDEGRSLDIATRIKSKAKKPFDNAYKAAISTEGAHYVQGFLVVAGRPNKILEHGWIVVESAIIDPTLPHFKKSAAELCYFPAQTLTVKALKAVVEEAKEDYPEDDPLPIYGKAPYEYYGDIMLGDKAYLDAYQAAEAYYKTLNQKSAESN